MKKKDKLTLLIADELKKMKEEAHLTQREIAKIMGIDRSTVGYYLSGDRKIYIDSFMDFCEACHKNPFEELDIVMERYRKK